MPHPPACGRITALLLQQLNLSPLHTFAATEVAVIGLQAHSWRVWHGPCLSAVPYPGVPLRGGVAAPVGGQRSRRRGGADSMTLSRRPSCKGDNAPAAALPRATLTGERPEPEHLSHTRQWRPRQVSLTKQTARAAAHVAVRLGGSSSNSLDVRWACRVRASLLCDEPVCVGLTNVE